MAPYALLKLELLISDWEPIATALADVTFVLGPIAIELSPVAPSLSLFSVSADLIDTYSILLASTLLVKSS